MHATTKLATTVRRMPLQHGSLQQSEERHCSTVRYKSQKNATAARFATTVRRMSLQHGLLQQSEECHCSTVRYNNKKIMVKSFVVRSLPVENLLPQNVGSIINYLQ